MKQEIALNILKTGRNVFLTGSAGTGKTYVINQYIQYLKERGVNPGIVAPTGIAASHIDGFTIHSYFGLGIKEKIDEVFLDKILQKEKIVQRLLKLKVLIIDEISMVSPGVFESMDIILKTVKFSNKPFGGVQVILSGDFFQLPPVSKEWKETRFVWQTDLWKELNLKILYLKKKYRQDESDQLSVILDEIRSGDISEKTWEIIENKLKEENKNTFQPTKLFTHNIDVDKINLEELRKLKSKSYFFEAFESGSKYYIQKIYNSSLVQKKLELKKDAVVIFIKNNYEENYINGTIGKVVGFDTVSNNPIVKTLSGDKILVQKEEWNIEDENGKAKATVRQIPLRLAWAITIHKSQGMSLDYAEIDLSKTFELGQGYVALSRVKTLDGLSLIGFNNKAILVDEQVLWIDQKFKKKSEIIEKQFLSFSESEKKDLYLNFLLSIKAVVDKKEIQKNIKKMKEEKEILGSKIEKEKSKASFLITKEYLDKKFSITKIAEIRELTENTILRHIQELKKRGHIKVKDIEFIKPNQEILESVMEAVEEIKKDNQSDDFTDDGEVKLSSIYKILDKEISYDDIKLALLFL